MDQTHDQKTFTTNTLQMVFILTLDEALEKPKEVCTSLYYAQRSSSPLLYPSDRKRKEKWKGDVNLRRTRPVNLDLELVYVSLGVSRVPEKGVGGSLHQHDLFLTAFYYH